MEAPTRPHATGVRARRERSDSCLIAGLRPPAQTTTTSITVPAIIVIKQPVSSCSVGGSPALFGVRAAVAEVHALIEQRCLDFSGGRRQSRAGRLPPRTDATLDAQDAMNVVYEVPLAAKPRRHRLAGGRRSASRDGNVAVRRPPSTRDRLQKRRRSVQIKTATGVHTTTVSRALCHVLVVRGDSSPRRRFEPFRVPGSDGLVVRDALSGARGRDDRSDRAPLSSARRLYAQDLTPLKTVPPPVGSSPRTNGSIEEVLSLLVPRGCRRRWDVEQFPCRGMRAEVERGIVIGRASRCDRSARRTRRCAWAMR